MGRTHTDLTGKVFGKLTVKNFVSVDTGGNAMWVCLCECGVERTIRASGLLRKRIGTKSCGCLNTATQRQTHCPRGHEFTPENTISTLRRRTCRTCKAAGDSKHYTDNKEALLAYRREWHLNSVGWTVEMFEAALKEQGGKCAICPKVLTFDDMCSSRVCADHKHTTPPKPRGLLCNSCNRAIGMLQDNPAILRAAAEYIEKFQ
jgi:hypothetical protein